MATENKKKTIGKAVTAFTLVICILALIFSIFLGGQKKLINECYTAVVRANYDDLEDFFADTSDYESTEKILKENYQKILSENEFELEETSIMHIRINFMGRKFLSPLSNIYYYSVTYYDDSINSYTTEKLSFEMKYNLGWKLCTYLPEKLLM